MNALRANDLARQRLQTAPGIGMGNFLWRALDAYSGDSRPIVSVRPLETAWGERLYELTLADFAALAERYAKCYAGLGVGRLDPVGVYVDHAVKYLVHLVALTRIGAIPVLVNERMEPAIAERHMRRVGVVGVFTDESRRAQLASVTEVPLGFTVVEDDFRTIPEHEVVPYVHSEHDPVLITHSSGTTGFPKAVLLQHGGFFYPVLRALDTAPDPRTLRVLSALPASHNAGVSAAAMAITSGREHIIMSDLSGAAVLRAIEEYRPTSVVAFPQTFVDILDSDPGKYDLSSVAIWFNLGDAAHEKHIRRLQQFGNHRRGRFAFSGSQFVDGLGSSEVGSTVFSIVHSPNATHFERCIGVPRSWVNAAIVDEDGTELEDGRPGLLAIKSPSICGGYWNDSKLTFKSRVNGYFLTGDFAVRDKLGRFYHVDRVTDMVTTKRGAIYTLLYEETILNAVDDMLDCAVVALDIGGGDAHVACLAVFTKGLEPQADGLRAEIDAAIAARDLQPVNDLRLIDREELAVGVTGKVLKTQLRASLRRELEQRLAAGTVA